MKKGYIVFLFALILFLVTGCGDTPEKKADALQARDVYMKSVAAMEDVNTLGFTMDMKQIMELPDSISVSEDPENKMEMKITSSGRMVQDPLAMEMDIELSVPGMGALEEFGNMEMKMYLVDNKLYMYESMFEQWMMQDMGVSGFDLEQLTGINQAGSDPLYYLKLIGEDGAAEATIRKEGSYSIIAVTDKEGVVLDRLMEEIVGQFDTLVGAPIDEETESLFNNLSFADFFYEMWVEDETNYTTKVVMSYKMAMTIEGETINVEQSAEINYKDFGTFTSIEVPEEVKASVVSMDDLLEDTTLPE